MQIIVNSQHIELTGSSIGHLCHQMQLQPQGIAIAVNGTVVPNHSWDSYCLNPNDQVTIIRATRGG
jgi:sulfur carrier protein